MKKLLCTVIALLFTMCNSAVAEDMPIAWLWDIQLLQNVETVISQLSDKTNIVLEQNEIINTLYEIPKGHPLLNINKIPFDIELRARSSDDEFSVGFGIPAGETYGISIRLEHSTKLENHPELSPDELLSISVNYIETIYQMLEIKLGLPIFSYLHIQNGRLLGTSKLLNQEIDNWAYFICPQPYDIDFEKYIETGSSVVSFNYCWGNISMSATYATNNSLQIEIEEKCWKTVSYAAFEEIANENTLDYFDFVEKQSNGVTSF